MIKKNFMTMFDVIFLLIVGAFGAKHFLCRNHLKFIHISVFRRSENEVLVILY